LQEPDDQRKNEAESQGRDSRREVQAREGEGSKTTDAPEEYCLHGIRLSELCEKCVIDHRTTQARDEW
jgi:hypothetical protein